MRQGQFSTDQERRSQEKTLADSSVLEILTELGSRFNIRFGELKAKYHNHQPSTKVVIDHKVEKEID